MPNWVRNSIHIEGPEEDVSKAIELMRDKEHESNIDFNNLIPMPERLNITSGGYDRCYVALYLKILSDEEKQKLMVELMIRPLSYYGNYLKKYAESFTMDIPEEHLDWMRNYFKERYKNIAPTSMEYVGKAYIDNILEYGHDAWYDWRIDNWGTKWNACECTIGEDYLEFDTAWSAPFEIVTELSKRFPELIFYHEWTDENWGYNCGRREFRNGEMTADEEFESGEEAYEFSRTLWGYGSDDIEEDE